MVLLPSSTDEARECENHELANKAHLHSFRHLAIYLKSRIGPLAEFQDKVETAWREASYLCGRFVESADQPWGFTEAPGQCFGVYIVMIMHIMVDLEPLRACKHPRCEARRKALDKAAPACPGWSSFRELIVGLLACWMPNIIHFIRQMIAFVSWSPENLPPFLCIDLKGVVDLCQWASRVACGENFNEGLRSCQKEGKNFEAVASIPYRNSEAMLLDGHDVCPNRIWNVSLLGTRGIADIHHITTMACESMASITSHSMLKKHHDCTQQTCLFSNDNSTLTKQLHKCLLRNCDQEIDFPPKDLDDAYKSKKPSKVWMPDAWNTTAQGDRQRLCAQGQTYMAISHVWSDGTGVGMKAPGKVNKCLKDCFFKVAKQVGCEGIWWDAISIPQSGDARKVAIDNMLENYKAAKVTLVHDEVLVSFPWRDDGSPAIALVLSAWFTRGWTAAELFASKDHTVKVVFGNPDPGGPPLIKDLDEDILAREVTRLGLDGINSIGDEELTVLDKFRKESLLNGAGMAPKQGHYIATDIVNRFRSSGRPEHLGNATDLNVCQIHLLLRARTTSWVRDRFVIPGLMFLPSFDSSFTSPQITKELLKRFNHVFFTDLFHGQIPMSRYGPWSWCPQSIFNLGDSHLSMNRHTSGGQVCIVDKNGVVRIRSEWFSVEDQDIIIPYGTHPANSATISQALLHRKNCILLEQEHESSENFQYILACPVAVTSNGFISCRWIGCVYLGSPGFNFDTCDAEPRRRSRSDFLFGDDCDYKGLPLPVRTIEEVSQLRN